jgi:hypothetical protein
MEQQIVAMIRAGCYAHVAAEATGIPREEFFGTLKQGRAKDVPSLLEDFASEVRTARAQARFRAEIQAYEQDPLAWLEHGPGREMPGDPGWSSPVRPHDLADHEFNPLEHPEFMDLLNQLLTALEKYPDVHAQFCQMLEGLFTPTRAPTSQTQGDPHDPQSSPSPLAPAAGRF